MAALQQRLTTEAIVEGAIEVATRDGLSAVSMRRVGAELGYTGMSLYSHVESKEALLDLMADHVIGQVPAIRDDGPWEEAVAAFFGELRAVLLAHRPLAPVFTMRPTRGPHTLAHSRRVLRRLLDSGLPAATAAEAYIALSCYTMGAALYAVARTAGEGIDQDWLTLGEGELPPAAIEQLARRADAAQFRSGLDHLISGFATDISG